MRIIIDLDGTICTEEKTYSRPLAKPLKKVVESLRDLHKSGHTIIIYSSRSWQEYEMTAEWLNAHKIKYHQLFLGKPIGDVWLDDRAIRFDNWGSVMKQLRKLQNKRGGRKNVNSKQ